VDLVALVPHRLLVLHLAAARRFSILALELRHLDLPRFASLLYALFLPYNCHCLCLCPCLCMILISTLALLLLLLLLLGRCRMICTCRYLQFQPKTKKKRVEPNTQVRLIRSRPVSICPNLSASNSVQDSISAPGLSLTMGPTLFNITNKQGDTLMRIRTRASRKTRERRPAQAQVAVRQNSANVWPRPFLFLCRCLCQFLVLVLMVRSFHPRAQCPLSLHKRLRHLLRPFFPRNHGLRSTRTRTLVPLVHPYQCQ
jgi:hypothetical protein